MRFIAPLVAVALVFVGVGAGSAKKAAQGGDWIRFGYDAGRSSSGPRATGITAANVGKLRRQQISLDGIVDSSPIYLRGVRIGGGSHDAFFVTTSYGKTLAIDADSGRVLWRFVPRGYRSWARSSQITQATPVADPNRAFVYAVSPNGQIHKLSVANGHEASGWPVSVTRDPSHEKIAPALNFSRGLVLVATGGYIGDAPPYQGHVVAIDSRTARIVGVWNSLCSGVTGSHGVEILKPSTCPESGSAIWARSGVVVDPVTHNLLVATGDGKFDGSNYWGDSVVMLTPRLQFRSPREPSAVLQNWTPRNHAELESGDVDLGSTAPALVGSRLAVQSGKDGKLRLLDLRRLNGTGHASPQTGGELQSVFLNGGLFSAPAVWRSGGRTWIFVTTDGGTQAFQLRGRRLQPVWKTTRGSTSPLVAGGLLYVYDASTGGLNVLRPTTGALVVRLAAGTGHWNSPIVTDGRVALPEGDSNDHGERGVLDIYRLP